MSCHYVYSHIKEMWDYAPIIELNHSFHINQFAFISLCLLTYNRDVGLCALHFYQSVKPRVPFSIFLIFVYYV